MDTIKLKIKAKLEIADHDGYCSGGECEYTCSIKTYIVDVPDWCTVLAEDYKYLVNYLPTPPNMDMFGSGYCDLSDECVKNDLYKHSYRYTILEATELDS